MRPIRQGDVYLRPINKIPVNARKLADKVLRYGEVTGHAHRFEKPEHIDRYEYEGKTYLQVWVATPLVHEEHNPLIIPVGEYEQIQEQEFDYFENDLRKVVD